MQQWEYQSIRLTASHDTTDAYVGRQLSEAGRDGWELVTVLTSKYGEYFILKRPTTFEAGPG